MNPSLHIPPFDPTLYGSPQFPNPFVNGSHDDDNSWRASLQPPSPQIPFGMIPSMPPPSSSLPQISQYSQNPFSCGNDGGTSASMLPPSSSIPPPYSQNPFSCGNDGGTSASMLPPSFSIPPPYSQNPFSCGNDGGMSASMLPPSSSIPPLYSHNPFSCGNDGGTNASMLPPSSSIPLPYSQNPFSCGDGYGGTRASMTHPSTLSSTPQPMVPQNFNPGPSVPRSLLSPSSATFSDTLSAAVEKRDSGWFRNPPLPTMAPSEPKDRLSKSELEKIEGDNKLLEMAKSDPKRVKRILRKRNSNARTKEKKALQLSELGTKVETLEKENKTLSSRFTIVHNANVSLMGHNKELMIRLEGLEKQAQLRNALIDRLNAEVKRLKVVTGEVSHYRSESDRSNMQPSNADMFHQANINQFHH